MFKMQGENTTLYLELKNGRVKDEELDPKICFLEADNSALSRVPKGEELLRKAIEREITYNNTVHATDVPPATKRRRLVLDYIVVPPRVQKRKLVKKSKMVVKKGKAKKEECTLPQSSIDARLKGIDPYPIPDEICADARVSRAFMTKKWGGNTQDTFPAIGKEHLLRHGLRDFMYLNRLYNPLSPRDHGATGLFFKLRSIQKRTWGGSKRVFVRQAANQWQYMGQYDHLPTPDLSQAEWLSMEEPVKNHWAKQIHKKDWGRECRISVAFRLRNQRKPTREEMTAALKDKDFKPDVTPEDIRTALDTGKEVIEVWAMKPIGYDLDFARRVHELWTNWIPPPPKSIKSTGTKAKKTDISKKSKTSKKSKKRKRSDVEDETEGV